jgi:hypothetical protein
MGLKKHHITNQDGYIIKMIAKKLPDVKQEVFQPRKTNERFRRVFNFLARLWVTGWICRWYFRRKYVQEVSWNHERRMRKAFQSHGILGVSHYLARLGLTGDVISAHLTDFENGNHHNTNHMATGRGRGKSLKPVVKQST